MSREWVSGEVCPGDVSRELRPKEYIKGSLVNFICEAKSVSKQDALLMITCSCKVVQ